ncbi:MAG: hypothetical protein QM755_14535 [Luteolibacter sp.]
MACVVAMVCVVAAISIGWNRYTRGMVIRWAESNGLYVVKCQYRTLLKGPFFFRASNSQAVFRIKVRDRRGQLYSGWVCCGGWFVGPFSDKIEVRWDG